MRFSLLFVDIDIRNKNKLDGVHMICCGLHRYAIHLYSGKTAVFYMHKILLYEVGTEKRQSLNFSRQIPIYTKHWNGIKKRCSGMLKRLHGLWKTVCMLYRWRIDRWRWRCDAEHKQKRIHGCNKSRVSDDENTPSFPKS